MTVTRFRPGARDGGSCLMTAMWLGALRQGAALEQAYGDKTQGAAATPRCADVAARPPSASIAGMPSADLFADDPDLAVFSQHMNVFAVLYDIATPEESRGDPRRASPCPATASTHRPACTPLPITSPGTWCAPSSTPAWPIAISICCKTWRDLLKLNFTTWPESRGETRSDTHAWSAHPTADLLGMVAGIEPAAPGYARLRIAPHLGDLTRLDATAVTPFGPVKVGYVIVDGRLNADIERPEKLAGDFQWRGRSYPLPGVHTKLSVSVQ